MDIEYIDLLQIHRFDENVPIEETMEALHDLIKSGKVRYIGASSMWAVQFAQMQFVAEKNGWTKVGSQVTKVRLSRLMCAVCVNAEPLQPPLPRRRTRDDSLL